VLFSLNVRDQALHPCKTTGKIIVLCEGGRNLKVQHQITSI
jgi:hypothetical protein